MTKLGAGKKIVITLLSIMLSLLAVFSALFIINKFTNNPEPQAGGEYTFTRVAISPDSAAYSNDTFLIGNADALHGFSLSVSSGHCDFSGKTVKLTADIVSTAFIPIGLDEDYSSGYGLALEVDGSDSFSGVFDGNGKTLTLSTPLGSTQNLYDDADEGIYLGMFAKTIGATIKNLRLNYTIENNIFLAEGKNNPKTCIGSIVGQALNTTIWNCAVDKFEFNILEAYPLATASESVYFGGVVGYFAVTSKDAGSIKQCYVGDFKFNCVLSVSKNSGATEIIKCSGITNVSYLGALTQNYLIVDYCVVNNGEKNGAGFKNWNIQLWHSGEDKNPTFASGAGLFLSSTIQGGVGGITNEIFNNTCCWAEGGCFPINSFTTTYWYLPPNSTFNNGAPYLKTFLKRQKYYFETEDDGTVEFTNNEHYDTYNNNGFKIACFKEEELPEMVVSTNPTIEFFGIITTAKPKTGYKFKSWKPNHGKDYLSYTACYEIIPYRVYYLETSPGSRLEAYEYTVESEPFTLEEPTKEGYEFSGWTGEGLTEPTKNVIIPTGSTGDKEYTANWELINYKITYNLNGGRLKTGEENPTEYNKDTETFTLYNPVRTGYEFNGWDDGSTFGSKSVTITKGSTGDREYTARWTPIEYTITYNLDGGALPEGLTNPETYNAETPTFTLINPEKPGFTFNGWVGDHIGLASIVQINQGSIGNRTYTAIYNDERYDVTFKIPTDSKYDAVIFPKKGDEDLLSTVNDFVVKNVISGSRISKSEKTDSNYNYYTFRLTAEGKQYAVQYRVLKGYTLDRITYNDEEIMKARQYYDTTERGELEIYLKPVEYQISYDLQGGWLEEGKQNPTSYTVEDHTIRLNNPIKTGYTFTGWTGTGLSELTENVVIEMRSYGDRTYTANWTENSYSITYSLGGGSLPSGKSNPTSYTIDSADITLNNPTKVGYTFTGWTGSNGTTPETTITIPTGSTGDRSYTANWTQVSYSITYNLNGGDVAIENPTSYTVHSADITLNNPTKVGYTFTGWTGSNGDTPETAVTIPSGSTGHKSYEANWEIITYTISYNLNGGTNHSDNPTTYTITDSFSLKAATPESTDFTFAGWTGTNDETGASQSSTVSEGTTGNLTFEANWTDLRYNITFKNIANATMKVNGVSQSADYTVNYVSPNEKLKLSETKTDGVFKYAFTITAQGIEYTIEFTINKKYIKDKITFNSNEITFGGTGEYQTTSEGEVELLLKKKPYDVEYA